MCSFVSAAGQCHGLTVVLHLLYQEPELLPPEPEGNSDTGSAIDSVAIMEDVVRNRFRPAFSAKLERVRNSNAADLCRFCRCVG